MGSWRLIRTAAAFAWLGIAAAACSSSGGSPPAPAGVSVASDATSASASVAFTLVIPAASRAGVRRDYVSAGTKSASIAVSTGGKSDGSPTILNCSSGQSCTVAVPAPAGSDTFTVTLWSATNATGAKLGIGATTKTVLAGGNNSVAVTLNGVVNSVALAISGNASLPAGTAAIEKLTVDALDADGYTIVAPGGYVDTAGAPVTISVVKTDYGNGAGQTTFASPAPSPIASAPGTTLEYTYNGSDIDETVFRSATSEAIGGAQGTAKVTYVPTFIKKYTDTSEADTNFIATGADGSLWFTDYGTGAIGSLVPSTGAITHYTIPTSATDGSAEPEAIVAGPNAFMYWVEYNSNAIGFISTQLAGISGAATLVTEIPLTTANANPRGIAYDTACDSNVWFTEFNGDKIGKLSSTTMTVTEYAVTTASAQPDQIACGPDGNFWFTEFAANKIGTITPSGTITEYALPNPTAAHGPIGIVAGADGSMWFAESAGNMVSKITTSKTKPATTAGKVTEYALPAAAPNAESTSLLPSILTSAPDGNIFFSEFNSETQTTNAAIGRITTSAAAVPATTPGVFTSSPLTASSNMPYGLTVGPDGHIWFVEMGSGAIGYIIY